MRIGRKREKEHRDREGKERGREGRGSAKRGGRWRKAKGKAPLEKWRANLLPTFVGKGKSDNCVCSCRDCVCVRVCVFV